MSEVAKRSGLQGRIWGALNRPMDNVQLAMSALLVRLGEAKENHARGDEGVAGPAEGVKENTVFRTDMEAMKKACQSRLPVPSPLLRKSNVEAVETSPSPSLAKDMVASKPRLRQQKTAMAKPSSPSQILPSPTCAAEEEKMEVEMVGSPAETRVPQYDDLLPEENLSVANRKAYTNLSNQICMQCPTKLSMQWVLSEKRTRRGGRSWPRG